MTAPGISLAEWKSLTEEAVRELMEKYFKSEGSFGDEADMPGISHEAQLWLDDFEMYPANNSSMTYLSEHSGRSNAYKALAPPATTDFQFEQYAAEPPPVTKQSLSELDIQNIITNIKLRHDVSFDQDLSFQPEMNYMTNRKLRHNIRIDRELSFRPDIDGRTPQQKQHTNISPMNPAISKGEHPLYGHPADQLFQSLKRIPKASVVEVFEIPGVLHASGRKYTNNALGDYCAKFNFMKASHAAKLGLSVDQSDTKDVAIGSGKKVKTLGTVQATYQFATEPNLHQLLFHVLPSCVHDVILGKPFLKATRTLSSVTNFARRIKKRALEGLSRHRLFFLGDSAPTFTGLINGRPGDALADSGSSVLVMDQDYAQTLGLQILTGKAYHTRLVFADGSTAYTSGVTRGVRWQFGLGGDDEDHYLDFHILKNAPARVILSDSFLFDTEAYSRYECYLLDNEDEEKLDEDAYFFTISHDPSYGAHDSIDMSTIANLEFEEQCRRNRVEDHIQSLPEYERDAARAKESERRRNWEQAMEIKRGRTLGHRQDPLRSSTTTHIPPIQISQPPAISHSSSNAGQAPYPLTGQIAPSAQAPQLQNGQAPLSRLRRLRFSLRRRQR